MNCCHSLQSKFDEEKGITAASIKLAGGDMIELLSIHMLAGFSALE